MLFNPATVLGASLAVVAAETIHGVVLVNRHGDRTTKHYHNQQLTNLGYRQSFDAGSFFRSAYVADGAPRKILGISPDVYDYPLECHKRPPHSARALNGCHGSLHYRAP
ncbi:hypothetical protein BKA61DRAFT_684575 [Leptodontidium sp. MPI-SDFR-AT-0119]|nr:hypothetical protein BKA61DRAFT_684575 [Leptodontidium sp. MPI-SDFR-AT-0119]